MVAAMHFARISKNLCEVHTQSRRMGFAHHVLKVHHKHITVRQELLGSVLAQANRCMKQGG